MCFKYTIPKVTINSYSPKPDQKKVYKYKVLKLSFLALNTMLQPVHFC